MPATGPVLDADTLTDPERLAEAIATAAMAAAQGDTAGARHFAEQLAGPDRVRPEVAAGVERASRRIITRAFEFGWLPSDVHQAARRRLDEFAVGYLTDLMADHRAPFADDTVDEIWQAQLDELGATVWWTPPHLIPWADRALLTGAEAVTTVLDALALLLRLPKLEIGRAHV